MSDGEDKVGLLILLVIFFTIICYIVGIAVMELCRILGCI